MEEFLNIAGIPLLVFAVLVYYGIRLLVMQDINSVRGKNKPPVKDEAGFSRAGGKLLLGFAGATLVMIVLLFVNVTLAVGEIIVAVFVFAVLWKKMNDKYGATL